MPKYPREWYVKNHREMWLWISEQILQKRSVQEVDRLRSEWLIQHSIKGVSGGSFPCYYMESVCVDMGLEHFHHCSLMCLFNWSPKSGEKEFVHCVDGIYRKCLYARDWKYQYELAKKIANLEVRELDF